MNLYELQSQWDSEHDKRQSRLARAFVKSAAKPANLIRDGGISMLSIAVIVLAYVAF